MKKYFAPTIEIIELNAADIIATSGFSLMNEEVDENAVLSRDGDWMEF